MDATNKNFEEVSKKISELSNDIDRIAEAYRNESNIEKKRKQEIELSTLDKMFSLLRDKIGDTLMSAGRTIHSKTQEELEIESFIEDVDLKLEKDDFDAVAIIDYMSSKKIVPRANSLTVAEANLILLESFEKNKDISKIILIHQANLSLLLHKNLKNPKFVKNFAKDNDIVLSENSLVKILDKYKNYKKLEHKNIMLICDICSVDLDAINNIKKADYELKKLILNKEYPTSIEHSTQEIKDKIKILNERKNLSPNEAFISIADKWLALGLPDPKDKLKQQLNAKIAQQFVYNSDSENKAISKEDFKIKSSTYSLK